MTTPAPETSIRCTDCGGSLEASGEGIATCSDCDAEFHVVLVPRARRQLDSCPDCSKELRMGGPFGGRLVCTACEREWTIRERTWLDPVDP